jgi:hypothetical protein
VNVEPQIIADTSWAGLEVLVLAPTPTYPLNAGNRLRIYHLNTSLRQMGARITYVHYPAEADWRQSVSRESVCGMQAQWDVCHIVPPTRPLHPNALGVDHLIDEWWDPAIGDMLAWLFRTQSFDVFIVNYAWLSKAFSYCPRDVLKILDTHDRLSDRRDLLARSGIASEFFHTTEDQERIALDRTDIVWSIKHDEAAAFRALTSRRVINMPYAAPLTPMGRRGDGTGILRFGIAGAANSINQSNIVAFLAEAEDFIRHTLLPCEIVIAGSVCDLLPARDVPWLRRLGRVADMAEFYRAIDVVLAPIAFSTGLKIKVGEALCHGRAVVALEHAFEGFRPLHLFHRLSSLREMMRACRDIVNDPTLIDMLETLSIRSAMETNAEATRGLEETVAVLRSIQPGLCIVVDADDLFHGSLVADHVREVGACLGRLGPVNIFVDGDADGPAERDGLLLLAQAGKLILDPALLGSLERDAQAATSRLQQAQTFAGMLEVPQNAFWFASCPRRWPAATVRLQVPAYVACDSILQSAGPEELANLLVELRLRFEEVIVLSRSDLHSPTQSDGINDRRCVPLLWRGDDSTAMADLLWRPRDSIAVLADTLDDPLLAFTVSVVVRLCDNRVDVILPRGPDDLPLSQPDWLDPCRVELRAARDCFRPRPTAEPGPALVLDLATDARLAGVREVFCRLGVRNATLFATPRAWSPDVSAAGLFESAQLIRRLLDVPAAASDGAWRQGSDAARATEVSWMGISGELESRFAASL